MVFTDWSAPCPALTVDQRCGFVVAEATAGMEPVIAGALGIGMGCSMADQDTTDEAIQAFDDHSLVILRGVQP